jgi:hypothetical protein
VRKSSHSGIGDPPLRCCAADFLGGGQALAVRVSGFIIGWEEHAFGDSLGYRCILSPTNDGTVSLAARSRAGSGDASKFHKAN